MSLTDKINALTAYANEVTGESDTTLSEAVHTLADGYGQGGGGDSIWNTIVDGTVTEIDDKDGLCTAVKDYTFGRCTSLTSVFLPSATSVGNYAFNSCTKLSSVDLPHTTSVGKNVFYGCTKLSSLGLPSATSIGASAFNGCTNLSFISLPSATTLRSSVFTNCSALTVADLPNVASILTYVFSGCTALKALILRKSDSICTLSSTNAFSYTPIAKNTGGYIYVPSSLIETYKTASQWSTFAAQFRALEDYTVDGTITGDLDPNKI